MGIIKLPPRKGFYTLVRVEKGFKMEVDSFTSSIVLTESQGQILKQLDESCEGLIAAELAKRLGMTHAGILYLLKPLLETGIVERVPLKGGGILYYSNFDIIEEKLSPELQEIKKKIEERTNRPLQKITIEELAQEVHLLPESKRRAFIDWILDGGWKKK